MGFYLLERAGYVKYFLKCNRGYSYQQRTSL